MDNDAQKLGGSTGLKQNPQTTSTPQSSINPSQTGAGQNMNVNPVINPPSSPSNTDSAATPNPPQPQPAQLNPPPPTPQSPEQVMMTSQSGKKGSKKILPLLIGLLIVIVGAVAGYFIYQNYQSTKSNTVTSVPTNLTTPQNPTTPSASEEAMTNKTYENKDLNISFPYPSDWTLQEDPLQLTNSAAGLIIVMTAYDASVMGEDYCGANPDDDLRCEQVTDASANILTIDWGPTSDSPGIVLHTSSDGTRGTSISITTTSGSALTEDNKAMFRQFLSTVQFLE